MSEQGGATGSTATASASDATGANQSAAADSGAAPEQTQAAAAAQPNDDPEYDLGGEKVKRSEYKRLRELEAKRKEYDRAASLRFEEASKKEKAIAAQEAQVKALVADFSKDTKAKLRALGIDPVRFAEETLAAELEEGSLTEEQRELRDLKAEKQKLAAEKAEREQAEAQRATAAELDRLTDDVTTDFLKVLEPRGLPDKDRPEILARMAHRVEALIDAGVPIDLADVADEVIERYKTASVEHFSGLTPEQAVEQYPEIAELFRKGLLAKHQKPTSPQPQSGAQRPGPRQPQRKRGLTLAEMREQIDKNVGA